MAYQSDGHAVYSNRAFVRFIADLPPRVAELVLLGRLDPITGGGHYPLPAESVRFVALPFYRKISSVRQMLGAVRESCRIFSAELDRLDAVWVFGPHPMAVLFGWIARRRGKTLILGLRQDYPRYIAGRLPGRRWLWAVPVAHALNGAFRRLAKRAPTVALGEELARSYAVGGPVLATGFSLVTEHDLTAIDDAVQKSWDGDRQVLTVSRLDPEKNPLLLLEIIAKLRSGDPRWRLVIAGDGPLRAQLEAEIDRRDLRECVEMRGEVPNGLELWSLYRRSHAFLHVSLTEGLPQVLFEAQAAGIPIVATDVGGVSAALNGGKAGLLIRARDADAAVAALRALAESPGLRRRLIAAGLERVGTETREKQLDRIATFVGQNIA
jgi:glycosyltransferase involved in cell wall biosynthesis